MMTWWYDNRMDQDMMTEWQDDRMTWYNMIDDDMMTWSFANDWLYGIYWFKSLYYLYNLAEKVNYKIAFYIYEYH